ncbi:XK-related 6 [Paramuricea clavata]|uniref:XK-related protein n=1 Tax=Paramuricea clavata TaxID=317549 RepID=A0A7D9JFV3_PARCT|nr:XK-related 6 [Paramuricea clavata]
MRGKKELFMLTTGFVLFMFDLVTDIVVATCIMAAEQTVAINNLQYCRLAFTCSSIFVRYVQEFKDWKQTHWDNPPCGDNYKKCNCPNCEQYRAAIMKSNRSAYKLAWVRYVETLTESTPQWCLQMYIMLRQWDFPWLTVLSAVISLLSLAWSMTALEKARVHKNRHNFTLPATVVFFTSQLFSLLSRLFAIVAFAYVFKEHVFTALAVHWLIVHVVSWLKIDLDFEGKCDAVKLFFGYSIFSCRLILHVPNRLTKEVSIPRTFYFVLYSIISVENVLLAILVVTIPIPDVKHMSVLRPIVLSLVIIGVVLGTIFLMVYNKHLKPTEERREEPTEEPTEEPVV